MSPSFFVNNSVNQTVSDMELSGQDSSVASSGYMQATDFKHFRFSKFMIWVGLARKAFCATLQNHIAHILGMVSDPQMVRLHTRGIITMMADAKPSWNRTEVKNPHRSMSSNASWIASGSMKSKDSAIATFTKSAGPKPAAFGFGDLSPKTLREVLRKTLRSQIGRGKFVHSYFSLPRFGYWPAGASSLSSTF